MIIPINSVVSAPMATALGFAYGIGPCLICSAFFLGPVFLSTDLGVRGSWKIILPLSLGRFAAYSCFGLIVGALGQYVKDSIATDTIRIVIGCAALMMGLALLLRKSDKACGSAQVRSASQHGNKQKDGARMLLPGGLFLMGVSMALTPCAPFGIVLFSAAMTGSAAGGLLLGMSFGLGAIVIPSIVYSVGMAYLSTRLREQLSSLRLMIERMSALILVAVGVSNLVRW